MKKILIAIFTFAGSAIVFYFLFSSPLVLSGKQIAFLASACLLLVLGVVFLILFFFRKNLQKIKWLESRLDVWNNISYHVNQAGDEVFNELPIGIATGLQQIPADSSYMRGAGHSPEGLPDPKTKRTRTCFSLQSLFPAGSGKEPYPFH